MIDLNYNTSYSFLFSSNDSYVSYNVYTLESREAYFPEEITINLADAVAYYGEIAIVSACFGVFAVFLAFKVRGAK